MPLTEGNKPTQAGDDAGPVIGVGLELPLLERVDLVLDEGCDGHGAPMDWWCR